MNDSLRARSLLFLGLPAALFAACDDSSAPASPTDDAGADVVDASGAAPDAAHDGAAGDTGGPADAAADRAGDADAQAWIPLPAPDGGIPTLLAGGSTFGPIGVTTDGYVIYWSLADGLSAMPLSGGATAVISPSGTDSVIVGKSVIYFGASPSFINGVWTNEHGPLPLTVGYASSLSSARTIAATPDGAKAAYVDANGLTLVTWGASGPVKTLLSSTITRQPSIACNSWLSFAANGDLLVDYCDYANDAATALHGAVLRGAAAPEATLVNDATVVKHSPDGAWLFATLASGDSELVRVSDGAVTKLDTGASHALFDATGATLFYNAGDALKRVDTSTGAVTTLLASGAKPLYAVSPDASRVVMQDLVLDDGSYDFHYTVVATTPPATPIALFADRVMKQDISKGDPFTADSTYFVTSSRSDLDGTRAAGGASANLSSAVFDTWSAALGSTIVYIEGNYRLIETDVSTATKKDLGSAQHYVLTPDRKFVVYATHAAPQPTSPNELRAAPL